MKKNRRMKPSKLWSCILGLTLLGHVNNARAQKANFSTKETTVRNAAVATVNNKEVLYVSSLSDGVGCYTLNGERLWSAKIETPAVIFEIEAADIDDDGNDDLLAASANGTIYCWASNGKLLWKFVSSPKVRFSEIALVNNGKLQVFAGGNDEYLYELNAQGKLVGKTKIQGVVRKIESGNFVNKGKEDLFVMTYSHDKFRWDFMGILDADTKKIVRSLDYKKSKNKDLSKAMVTDLEIADLNKDGLSDILFFGDVKWIPLVVGLDAHFNSITQYKGTRKDIQRYANTKGICLLPVKDEIVFQFGGVSHRIDLKGKLIEKLGTRYANEHEIVYSDFVLAPQSEQLITAGEVDGGNGVYTFNLKKSSWLSTNHRLEGTMAQVKENLDLLYQQILDFKMPSYQKKSDESWVMVTSKKIDSKVQKLKGNKVEFVIQRAPKESTDRAPLVAKIGKAALKKDKRGKYQDSRESIVNKAREYEKEGQHFTLWAGHGNDPFYIQIETLEQILQVAPTTCRGFVYAEMDNVDDPRVQHFVREYVPRLAKAIRKNKNRAKLYFRYKNTFWGLTNKLPLWQELFFSNKYNDILAPASEDTSNRTQDINLTGRVGMFVAGYVDDFAMRLIDDNPTSWRPLSPGGQKSISPYLRQGVMMAAYGAKHGVVADNNFTEEPGLNILFGLMKSGALPLVEREDILSIGSWHLIKEVDEHLIHSIDSHHTLKQYKPTDTEAVFSVTQMHWAGTDIPDHDYSKIALGVDYRWLNYMPIMPNGMVPIAPIEYAKELEKNKIPYSVSNGSKGISNGKLVTAKTYMSEFKEILAKGKSQLPIVVNGASWSAVRIDEHHVRVILVDPGYIEPKDRNVEITFNGKQPKSAIDILSKESIKIVKGKVSTKVLAGSLQFIDLTY
ncbi:pyrrolo-quinoline quinone [Ochrovirga pacifica]|uniref:pyrrolo-quinoline quinone n=1 Tax=Ochrovirga pacifica TaxID=1042376 RepID=UPI000255955E|nr:pyrrolo-quinoline quinone [Ochrovirga pacifica]